MPVGWPQRVGHGECERLWRIRSSGREVLRFSAENLTPLPRGQIENPTALPAGATGTPVVHLKKQIKLQSRTATTNIFTLDIGQSIELYGFSVDIDILAPLGTAEISTSIPASTILTRSGLVIDAVLAVEILALEAPLGQKIARLTQHVFVEADTQVSIPIPNAAIGGRILQTTAGAASPTWTRWIGDPAIHSSLQVGPIVFANRVSEMSSTEIGDCTTLQTDLDAVNDRFYTLIWRIRP